MWILVAAIIVALILFPVAVWLLGVSVSAICHVLLAPIALIESLWNQLRGKGKP